MKQANLNQIKNEVLPILKAAGVTHSSLFGSYVRGEERRDSDIDILVDFPQNKSLLDFIELKLELEDVLHKSVDLVEYKMIKSLIRDKILSEQVQIL